MANQADADLRAIDTGVRELASAMTASVPSALPADALAAALTIVLRARGDSPTIPTAAAPAWANDPMTGAAELASVRFRHVKLAGEWWLQDGGPLLAFRRDGDKVRPVALLPVEGGYTIHDPSTGEVGLASPALLHELLDDAITFYRPLPEPTPGFTGLLAWAASPHRRALVAVAGLMGAVTLLGMLVPVAAGYLVDDLLPSADRPGLFWLMLALVAVILGQTAFRILDEFITVRLQVQITLDLQAAVWDRLLRLPVGFFRRFLPGELLQRAMAVTQLAHTVHASTLRSLLSGIFALMSAVLMFYYAARVAFWAIAAATLTACVMAWISLVVRRRAVRLAAIEGRVVGFVVGLIRGVARIRASGAEARAFGQWASRFAEQLRLETRIQRLKDVGKVVALLLAGIGTVVVFAVTGASVRHDSTGLTAGQFVAFLTAYGAFAGGLLHITDTIVQVIDGIARMRLAQPILSEPLEPGPSHADPGRLNGSVAVENVSFRYRADGPMVLSEVTITAAPGEFIAVVGPSGSGKSTLLRLLVGFERPEIGRVTFDGFDIRTLHLLAVRRQLGVVLQSANVFAATVFDNIAAGHVVTAEQVWEAAHAAAFADDIQKMAMKLHTPISDGGTNLSGGQRQRLLLARALVANPRILILDEATSALDNPTQAMVTAALKERRITRIVVAHRLSAIAHADRIYVLDRGRVVQCGRFDELLAQEGLFRQLAARQRAT
jgi:ATP-binding cassette subfamily C protein